MIPKPLLIDILQAALDAARAYGADELPGGNWYDACNEVLKQHPEMEVGRFARLEMFNIQHGHYAQEGEREP